MIKEDQKIDLDQLINEFVQMVDENSPEASTDPNVKRVKVIRAQGGCACGNCFDEDEFGGEK